jgi:hypothetical protein
MKTDSTYIGINMGVRYTSMKIRAPTFGGEPGFPTKILLAFLLDREKRARHPYLRDIGGFVQIIEVVHRFYPETDVWKP